MLNLTVFTLALPLAGFIILGLFGRGMPRALIAWIGCGTIFLAFAAAAADFISMLGYAGPPISDLVLFNWVASGSLRIDFGLLSDPLSAIMLLIVTGVGFLIHVYSVGYMADDEGYWRFFSFLNLFVFAMALLVAADNFLFLLAGWAGVGLASFLLIGFWYTRPSAVAAAQKAFVVNVIGDFGLMLAIFLLFKSFGTLGYHAILYGKVQPGHCPQGIFCDALVKAHPASAGMLTAITLLLFAAAAAKSAQLPLHVWLPDAMEGPTPVSALIHAATMVTAGVYLVARAAPIFTAAPIALAVVGAIGGATALFAATIACVQTDIKRVLAYSTMSQLGYMFMGEAAGGFSTGIFHLTTHAYFKALLFMSAGAVIHALAGEQDMRKMGGLRRVLPTTFWCFVGGGLALAAIFPFAGFWSKDSILGALLAHPVGSATESYVLYAVGIVTAVLTGFYTFRMIFAVFRHEYRGGEIVPHGAKHGPPEPSPVPSRAGGKARETARRDPLARVHEVGPAMRVPMLVLLVLSVIGGLYGTPWANWLGEFLAPVTGGPVELAPSDALFWVNVALGLVAALLGIGIAWVLYGRRQPSFALARSPLVVLLQNHYYVDAIYDRVIVRPLLWIGRLLRRDVEGVVLDGGTRGVGSVIAWSSGLLRTLQTGYARNYALGIFLGAALIVLYYVVQR